MLTKEGMNSLYPIFMDWEDQVNVKYKPKYGTPSWPVDRPKFGGSEYMKRLIDVRTIDFHIGKETDADYIHSSN